MKYALSSKISIIRSYNDFDPKLNPFYIHFRAQITKFAPQNRYRKNNKIRTTFFDVLGSILAPLDPQKSFKKIEKNDPWRLLGLLALLGVPKGPFWGPFGLFWGCPGGPFWGPFRIVEGSLLQSTHSGAIAGAKLGRSHLG